MGSRQHLARILGALVVVLLIAELAVSVDPFSVTGLIPLALTVAFAAVGTLVAARHPANPIGWIFLGVGIATELGRLAGAFADHAVQDGDPGTLAAVAATYANAGWIPFVLVPATVLLLLFPDGRLPSRRWRWVARLAVAGIAGVFIAELTNPEIADYPTIDNPLGLSVSYGPLFAVSFLMLFAAIGASAVSLLVRYRRGGPVLRQQIKWLAAAGGLVAVTIPVMVLLYDVVGEAVANAAMMLSVLTIPIAAGAAILRYRLFDIDVVINRALVYGALTALLGAAYAAGVLLLQLVLDPSSNFAIVVSTLAVIALAAPARRRIQATVDRRFFRRRYDAQRTLEAFSSRVRGDVGLEALAGELGSVVAETMQPAHVSVWIRPR